MKLSRSNIYTGIKTMLGWASVLVFFIGSIIIYNILDPVGFLPHPEKGWQAGYYEDTSLGKIWLLAKFYEEDHLLKLMLMGPDHAVEIFTVNRDSRNPVLHYTMKNDADPSIQINAKQLVLNERYPLQRLLVGRFKDFWKRNDEELISGYITEGDTEYIFKIDKIQDEKVVDFYNDFVLGEKKYSSLAQILSVVEELKKQ